jgi:AcrR family transcriptional regulator
MMTKTPTINRRDHLVDTAIDLFSEQGFASTSIKSIAQAAGVSQGLLYNYFSSKEELLRYIFRQGIEQINESYEEPAPGTGSQLQTYLRHTFEMIRRERKFWRLFHTVRMQSGIRELLDAEIRELQGVVVERLQRLLAPYVAEDSHIEALLLHATIDGIAAHSFLTDDNYPLEDVIRSLVEIYDPSAD